MGGGTSRTLWLAATLWLTSWALHAGAEQPVWLDVAYPGENESVVELIPLLEVRGRAVAGPASPYDMVIGIDLSASTLVATGFDIDGDGVIGATRPRVLRRSGNLPSHRFWTTDPDDTVARAELLAAQRLLRRLDERWARVGIITFAGRSRVRARLGHPEDALSALESIRVTNDRSGTNLSSVIRAGVRALRDSPEDRERILVILSDGYPTAPAPEIHARTRALRAAERAAREGVRIFAFAIGQEALARPDALREVARLTSGRFFEVREPGEVVQHLPRLDVALLEDVSLVNGTTGATGRAVRVFRDGSFDGYVQLEPGENHLIVEARAPDGERFRVERTVHYSAPGTVTVGDMARASDLREELAARTAETELAARANAGPAVEGSVEIELDRAPVGAR